MAQRSTVFLQLVAYCCKDFVMSRPIGCIEKNTWPRFCLEITSLISLYNEKICGVNMMCLSLLKAHLDPTTRGCTSAKVGFRVLSPVFSLVEMDEESNSASPPGLTLLSVLEVSVDVGSRCSRDGFVPADCVV